MYNKTAQEDSRPADLPMSPSSMPSALFESQIRGQTVDSVGSGVTSSRLPSLHSSGVRLNTQEEKQMWSEFKNHFANEHRDKVPATHQDFLSSTCVSQSTSRYGKLASQEGGRSAADRLLSLDSMRHHE